MDAGYITLASAIGGIVKSAATASFQLSQNRMVTVSTTRISATVGLISAICTRPLTESTSPESSTWRFSSTALSPAMS